MLHVLPYKFPIRQGETAHPGVQPQPEISFPIEGQMTHPLAVRGQFQGGERLVLGRVGETILPVGGPDAAVPVREADVPGARVRSGIGILNNRPGKFVHDESAGLSLKSDMFRILLPDVGNGIEHGCIQMPELAVAIPVESAFGADPQGAVTVGAEGEDMVVVQGVFFSGGKVCSEAGSVEPVEPAHRPHPDVSVGVLGDGGDLRIGQRQGESGILGDGRPGKQEQPGAGGYEQFLHRKMWLVFVKISTICRFCNVLSRK